MTEEKPDYHRLMAQARNYRQMADNDDGYRRRVLLGVAHDLEAEARKLLRQSQSPDPGKD